MAPPDGGNPLTTADLPRQNIGQPHHHPLARGRVGLLQRSRRRHRRWQPPAGRPRWAHARSRRRGGLPTTMTPAAALAPTLALAAIGLLGSITLGRSPMGLVLPALFALAMQVAQMLPLPVAIRVA